jgi:hypothetical protein
MRGDAVGVNAGDSVDAGPCRPWAGVVGDRVIASASVRKKRITDITAEDLPRGQSSFVTPSNTVGSTK